MKVKCVNGESVEPYWELEIEDFETVGKIKQNICEYLKVTKKNFLIYKNCILNDENYNRFYKIETGDQIWWGSLENYLKEDKLILNVFLAGYSSQFLYLIVNSDYSVNDIKREICGVIRYLHLTDIKTEDGSQSANNPICCGAIHLREHNTLIFSLDDEISRSFDNCCDIFDQYLLSNFWWTRYLFSVFVWNADLEKQMKCISEIYSSIVPNDTKFQETIPLCFRNSKPLLCTVVADNILEILADHRQMVGKRYMEMYPKGVFLNRFEEYFSVTLRLAILNYFDKSNSITSDCGQISLDSIVYESLNYIKNCPINSSEYWRVLAKSIADRILLKNRTDKQINNLILQRHSFDYFYVRLHGSHVAKVLIPKRIVNVLNVKKAICLFTGVPMENLYLINHIIDHKPKDNDNIDVNSRWDFLCEIISSIEGIEILRKVGQGAFGIVYLAEKCDTKEQFVLKQPLGKHDLYREISIHSKIGLCGHIYNYLGLYSYLDQICCAMEYLPGGTLEAHLKKGKLFMERDISKMCHQLLQQIFAMHNKGVIHRDIKSDNIVLDENLNAKLVDFGLSKYNRYLTPGELLEHLVAYKPGTIYYMAPEILNRQLYNEKVDTWSFGATLVEIVTGKRPFSNLLPVQVAVKIARCQKIDFKLPDTVSKELKEFLNSCLTSNCDQRATISELMKSDFIQKHL